VDHREPVTPDNSVSSSGNASALSVAADADRHLHPKPPTGGFRLVHITDPANPTEVGRYVDPNGNNFLGVALPEDQNCDRIMHASDRGFDLFIFAGDGSDECAFVTPHIGGRAVQARTEHPHKRHQVGCSNPRESGAGAQLTGRRTRFRSGLATRPWDGWD
jgi:hypothetical protein